MGEKRNKKGRVGMPWLIIVPAIVVVCLILLSLRQPTQKREPKKLKKGETVLLLGRRNEAMEDLGHHGTFLTREHGNGSSVLEFFSSEVVHEDDK